MGINLTNNEIKYINVSLDDLIKIADISRKCLPKTHQIALKNLEWE